MVWVCVYLTVYLERVYQRELGGGGGRGSNLVLEKFHVSPFLIFVSIVVVLSAIGGVIGASYAGV